MACLGAREDKDAGGEADVGPAGNCEDSEPGLPKEGLRQECDSEDEEGGECDPEEGGDHDDESSRSALLEVGERLWG